MRQNSRSHPDQLVLQAACLFAGVALLLHWWRLQTLTATYDQGIFLQVLWNGLRGHPFESTLSSQLSADVIHAGQLPAVGYHRLGQHFTPLLALWIPVVGLLGPWALPLIQVGLMTAAGLVLHRLASLTLPDQRLAAWLACSFFAANAVVGPTLGNFTDLCQLPLLFFLLMLGLEKRRWWLVILMTIAVPLVREDTGVLLGGVAIWLAIRHPDLRRQAMAMAAWGLGWVVLVTNVLMPLFSDDNSRRFMVENFGHLLGGEEQISSLELLLHALKQPWILLRELVDPPGASIKYLLSQGLPLLFVPLLSLDSWILIALPLAGLLVAQGKPSPLSINVRYALLVVPGLFAGAVYWWQGHGEWFQRRRWRSLWIGAMALSLSFALIGNPHRSLSFLIPESINPWIHRSASQQWRHGQVARRMAAMIPPSASVSAGTTVVPLLARREVLVRFPRSLAYRDRDGQEREVAWILADLRSLQRVAAVSDGDRNELAIILQLLPDLLERYSPVEVSDGFVLLQRGAPPAPEASERLDRLMAESEALLNTLPAGQG